jgi:ubiquinone/menaquinone biosynthesis C-methylase UbiE
VAAALYGRQIRSVVDLGGGSGVFSRRLGRSYPSAHFLQVDLEEANRHARASAHQAGLAERFTTLDGDVLTLARELPASDVVLCCHLLHYFSRPGIASLLADCRRAVAPGGCLVVADFITLADQQPGPFRTLFDVFLRAHSASAGVPTMDMLLELARDAGFPAPPKLLSLAPRPTNVFVFELPPPSAG